MNCDANLMSAPGCPGPHYALFVTGCTRGPSMPAPVPTTPTCLNCPMNKVPIVQCVTNTNAQCRCRDGYHQNYNGDCVHAPVPFPVPAPTSSVSTISLSRHTLVPQTSMLGFCLSPGEYRQLSLPFDQGPCFDVSSRVLIGRAESFSPCFPPD